MPRHITAKAAKLQDVNDAILCPAGGWTIVGTTEANFSLQTFFGEMHPGLMELRYVIFNKFRLGGIQPWLKMKQDPLQILQSLTVSQRYVKYSDHTKDHYRLNIVLRTGRKKLKNKCTVVPYVPYMPYARSDRTDMCICVCVRVRPVYVYMCCTGQCGCWRII